MKNIIATTILLALTVFIFGCGDPNEEFKPAADKQPNVPVSQAREKDSGSFLPPSGGARTMTADDENVLGGR